MRSRVAIKPFQVGTFSEASGVCCEEKVRDKVKFIGQLGEPSAT